MKKFLKGVLIICCMVVSVPVTIMLLAALFGFGSLIMIMPEVIGGILIILAIFCNSRIDYWVNYWQFKFKR